MARNFVVFPSPDMQTKLYPGCGRHACRACGDRARQMQRTAVFIAEHAKNVPTSEVWDCVLTFFYGLQYFNEEFSEEMLKRATFYSRDEWMNNPEIAYGIPTGTPIN